MSIIRDIIDTIKIAIKYKYTIEPSRYSSHYKYGLYDKYGNCIGVSNSKEELKNSLKYRLKRKKEDTEVLYFDKEGKELK